ncbi:DnaJ domain-containing protein [Annulohypoxylon bovei var. microspora]|nr:DnaJ domain-containing protein [Annulohypoxylon bovei var. microspora]
MPHPTTVSFNPYKILGVNRDANVREIKKSYHRLCLQFHPDKTGSTDHEEFIQIQEAYELLSDKIRRSEYDRRTPDKSQNQSPPSQASSSDEDESCNDDSAKLKSRAWAIKSIDKAFKTLDNIDEQVEQLKRNSSASKSVRLQRISSSIAKTRSNIAALLEQQVKGVPKGQWKTDPQTPSILNALYQVDLLLSLIDVGICFLVIMNTIIVEERA